MYYEQLNDLSDLGSITPTDTSRIDHRELQSGDGRIVEDVLPESLVLDFERVANNWKELSQDQGKLERGYLNLCQLVQREQKQWKRQQQELKHLETENFRLSKELGYISNKLKQSEAENEAKVDKCRNMESKIDEMREAFELMSEIVFDDENDMSCSRRAQIEEIQSSFKKAGDHPIGSDTAASSITNDEMREPSLASFSDVESELNGAYGDMYTSALTRHRQSRDWTGKAPVPSGRSVPTPPVRPPPPIVRHITTSNTASKNSSPARLPPPMSPLKSKRNMTLEEPSFSTENVPERDEIYDPATPPRDQMRSVGLLPAVDGMPMELVLYVSALSNKLGHPDLYVTSPETEEVQIIETTKEAVRNIRLDETELLAELNTKSTNVLCQLVKDFFNDNEEKLFDAQSGMMRDIMQAVRCCNESEIEHLLRSLKPKKQLQLAFLIRHLQSAVDAGRLPGELADTFGTVIVSRGPQNRNDPKELCEKLILLDAQFYNRLMNDASADRLEAGSSTGSLGSMLGPVPGMESDTASVSRESERPKNAKLKKMIDERRHKLLANCDIRLFTSPKTK